MKKPPKLNYDDIDLRIIEAIKDNARISYKNLSETVNLSVPSIYELIKELEDRKVVRG